MCLKQLNKYGFCREPALSHTAFDSETRAISIASVLCTKIKLDFAENIFYTFSQGTHQSVGGSFQLRCNITGAEPSSLR